MRLVDLFAAPDVAVPHPRTRNRLELDDRFKWNLDDIFPGWDDWAAAYDRLEKGVERYATLKGTLAEGPGRLLEAFKLSEELGQLAYKVWYFPSLRHDEDQRDNSINARRQQVQLLFARWKQASLDVAKQHESDCSARKRPASLRGMPR